MCNIYYVHASYQTCNIVGSALAQHAGSPEFSSVVPHKPGIVIHLSIQEIESEVSEIQGYVEFKVSL